MNRIYHIGIDPGKDTGIALYNESSGEIEDAFTTDFWGAYDYVTSFEIIKVGSVNIEIPHRKDGKTNKGVWHNKGNRNIKSQQRTGVNVGYTLNQAELLIARLTDLGYPVVKVNPRGKLDSDVVERITGYKGRTNPHVRDAIMMCYKANRSMRFE